MLVFGGVIIWLKLLTRRCDEEIIDDGRVEGTMIYLPPEVQFFVPSVDGT